MGEKKGVVKHVVLVKFKDGVPADEVDQLIKGVARLVHHIEPMKSLTWGKNISIENLHQGFTHIFESTFESNEGLAEYIKHPAHVDFSNIIVPQLEKILVFDYKPTVVNL